MTNVRLPNDANSKAIQLSPDTTSLATTEITALTTHLLNTNTTMLELFNESETLVLKWGTTTITSTNYDAIIVNSQIRHLVVPEGVTNIMIAKIVGATLPTKLYLIEL